MKAYLKIKIKSLAAEAKIIRADENRYLNRVTKVSSQIAPDDYEGADMDAEELLYQEKLKGQREEAFKTFDGLYQHRKNVVGTEQRSALLAYAFIRGMPYHRVEASCYTLPNWNRVADVVLNFAPERVVYKINASESTSLQKMRRKVEALKVLQEWYGVIRPTNNNKYAPELAQ